MFLELLDALLLKQPVSLPTPPCLQVGSLLLRHDLLAQFGYSLRSVCYCQAPNMLNMTTTASKSS